MVWGLGEVSVFGAEKIGGKYADGRKWGRLRRQETAAMCVGASSPGFLICQKYPYLGVSELLHQSDPLLSRVFP